MPALSQILGGIVKDIAQAQLAGELVALEHLSVYHDHEILRHLSPPRVRIKDVSLTLRFAIDNIQEVSISKNAKAAIAQMWRDHVRATLIPSIFDEIGHTIDNYEQLKPILSKALRGTSAPRYHGNALLNGQFSAALKETEDYFASIIKSIPADIRANLPNLRTMRQITRRKSQLALIKLSPMFQKVAAAKSVQDLDLQVLVTKDDLQGLSESELQELSFTLTVESNPLGMD